jgi:hypothetical protein
VPLWAYRVEAVLRIVGQAEDVSAWRLRVHTVRRVQLAGAEALAELALLLGAEVAPRHARLVQRAPLPAEEHQPVLRHEHLYRAGERRREHAVCRGEVDALDLAPARVDRLD